MSTPERYRVLHYAANGEIELAQQVANRAEAEQFLKYLAATGEYEVIVETNSVTMVELPSRRTVIHATPLS